MMTKTPGKQNKNQNNVQQHEAYALTDSTVGYSMSEEGAAGEE